MALMPPIAGLCGTDSPCCCPPSLAAPSDGMRVLGFGDTLQTTEPARGALIELNWTEPPREPPPGPELGTTTEPAKRLGSTLGASCGTEYCCDGTATEGTATDGTATDGTATCCIGEWLGTSSPVLPTDVTLRSTLKFWLSPSIIETGSE